MSRKTMTLEAAVYALWDVYDSGTPITPAVIRAYIPALIPSFGRPYRRASLHATNCAVTLEVTDQCGPDMRTIAILRLEVFPRSGEGTPDSLTVAVQNPNHPSFNPTPCL